MFSIIIPTFNNLKYFKICLKSIKKKSKFNHKIIILVNDGSDGTIDFVKNKNIKYCFSKENIVLCKAVNKAAKLIKSNYLIYAHDDINNICSQLNLIKI